jgi:hypothetical protein
MLFQTLSYIGEKLNEENILWGVDASILLSHYNLVNSPNDIDILVALKDIHKADEILKSLGNKKTREANDSYSTEYFNEYVINGIDVDVMSGLTLNHEEGKYEQIFDEASIVDEMLVNDVKIPLTSLEDWYIIYQLIPGREYKVSLIENYLLQKGISNPILLQRALKCTLPSMVKERSENLI